MIHYFCYTSGLKTLLSVLNKKNWVWKCMKLMSTIKGIDNELAISNVIPSHSQLRIKSNTHSCI